MNEYVWGLYLKSGGSDTVELFAFLYDFAPKYIGGINSYIVKEEELPVPKSASQEGIWITSEDSRYTEVILSYKWSELNADNDKMYEVKKIIDKI